MFFTPVTLQFECFLAKTRLCFLNTMIILITFSSRRSWCSGLSYYYSRCQILFTMPLHYADESLMWLYSTACLQQLLYWVLCGSNLLHVCSNYLFYWVWCGSTLLHVCSNIIHWGLIWLYFCMFAVIVILCYSTDCMCMCMYRNKLWGWPVESRLCYRLVQYRTRAYFY